MRPFLGLILSSPFHSFNGTPLLTLQVFHALCRYDYCGRKAHIPFFEFLAESGKRKIKAGKGIRIGARLLGYASGNLRNEMKTNKTLKE
jgi:hypothetical protein